MRTTMEKKRIVFMGTPEFAVASLQALVVEGFNVVGVVTVPDKPAGRGQKKYNKVQSKFLPTMLKFQLFNL